ncbi:hypothetical protein PR048_025725 [Dryococelus australis]|uniref:Uncharacterized protein n=1 Tax=Dryococelus australis TaxID=614101 RepID=A0ABQ9GJE1_9NEOP|nr:hypothetical protein PR048_025725 [Dryococelus australis]
MPLADGFSRGSPVSPAPSFRLCSILTSLHPHRLLRPSHPNRFTNSPFSTPSTSPQGNGVPSSIRPSLLFYRKTRIQPLYLLEARPSDILLCSGDPTRKPAGRLFYQFCPSPGENTCPRRQQTSHADSPRTATHGPAPRLSPWFAVSDEAAIATAFRRDLLHIDGSPAANGISRLPHRWQQTFLDRYLMPRVCQIDTWDPELEPETTVSHLGSVRHLSRHIGPIHGHADIVCILRLDRPCPDEFAICINDSQHVFVALVLPEYMLSSPRGRSSHISRTCGDGSCVSQKCAVHWRFPIDSFYVASLLQLFDGQNYLVSVGVIANPSRSDQWLQSIDQLVRVVTWYLLTPEYPLCVGQPVTSWTPLMTIPAGCRRLSRKSYTRLVCRRGPCRALAETGIQSNNGKIVTERKKQLSLKSAHFTVNSLYMLDTKMYRDHGQPARLPPWRTGFNPRPGCGNRAPRCRWSAGFLGDLPFRPHFHSGAAPYSPLSPSSALKTSLLRDAQISSLFTHTKVERWHTVVPRCNPRGCLNTPEIANSSRRPAVLRQCTAPTHELMLCIVVVYPIKRDHIYYISIHNDRHEKLPKYNTVITVHIVITNISSYIRLSEPYTKLIRALKSAHCTVNSLHQINKGLKKCSLYSEQPTPNFRMWQSCRTMPLVGEFSRGFPHFSALSFQRFSIRASIILIASQDIAFKSRTKSLHSVPCAVRKFPSLSPPSLYITLPPPPPEFRYIVTSSLRSFITSSFRPRNRRYTAIGHLARRVANKRESVLKEVTSFDVSNAEGAAVTERLAFSPPTKANRVTRGIFACGNRTGRCRWFLLFFFFSGFSRYPHPFISAWLCSQIDHPHRLSRATISLHSLECRQVGPLGERGRFSNDVLYDPFTATSHFSEALLKVYFKDIPPPLRNWTLRACWAMVAERLAFSPPTKVIRVQSPAGSLRIFACGNRADDVVGRWVFSAISRFPQPFIPAPLRNHFNHPHQISSLTLMAKLMEFLADFNSVLLLNQQPVDERGSNTEPVEIMLLRLRHLKLWPNGEKRSGLQELAENLPLADIEDWGNSISNRISNAMWESQWEEWISAKVGREREVWWSEQQWAKVSVGDGPQRSAGSERRSGVSCSPTVFLHKLSNGFHIVGDLVENRAPALILRAILGSCIFHKMKIQLNSLCFVVIA